MSRVKHKNPRTQNRTATAPYNFVPLPEKVVTVVDDARLLPDHHTYGTASYTHTGYFDVVLTTKSPLYIRGGLSTKRPNPNQLSVFEKAEEQRTQKSLPFRVAIKNKLEFFSTNSTNQPVIPGSSLRGMLRNLLEIVSYGKVSVVTDSLKVFYRAVAADEDHPLKESYTQILGRNGANVRAGYLHSQDGHWHIQPARTPSDIGLSSKKKYLVVYESEIPSGLIPGLRPLKSKDYKPGFHPVRFTIDESVSFKLTERVLKYLQSEDIAQDAFKKLKKLREREFKKEDDFLSAVKQEIGEEQTVLHQAAILKQASHRQAATKIVGNDTAKAQDGYLVWSGNMLETNDEETESPRKAHTLVLQENKETQQLKIHPQAIKDYLDALTPFQKDSLAKNGQGVLEEGRPVFYVEAQSEVWFFGHSPNFRIPALLSKGQERRAATPRDFVPAPLRCAEDIDFADAIFGFTRTRDEIEDMKKRGVTEPAQGSKARAYASRVFITDAVLKEEQDDVYLPMTVPRILASPKPTTFQHYLAQDDDDETSLKHYGSTTPDETVIRGHKLYWHQGERKIDHVQESDPRWLKSGQVKDDSTQHTQIQPVKPNVKFKFQIYFENLSDQELGALCWILYPLGDETVMQDQMRGYRHALGMGKPLGLGAIKLDAALNLTDRQLRYNSLFKGDFWATGEASDKEENLSERGSIVKRFTDAFESYMLESLSVGDCSRLAQLKRIGSLLKLLEWPGFPAELPATAQNRWKTADRKPNPRYLVIELPNVDTEHRNEYETHPVLPDPSFPDFGGLTGDVEPEIDFSTPHEIESEEAPKAMASSNEAPEASKADVPLQEDFAIVQQQAPMNRSGVEYLLGSKEQNKSRETEQEKRSIHKTKEIERVILITAVQKRQAQVRTEQNEEIVCFAFPLYPPRQAGEECKAYVTRENGKAVRADYTK